MEIRLIALEDLRFGHEARPPINVRTLGRDTDLDDYVSSLRAHGLIHPLAVEIRDDGVFVADGNRRLAALRQLRERDEIDPTFEVPCDVLDAETDGAEISLAANIVRRPLHDADEYEAFWHLAQSGKSEAEIADRFGIAERRVARILALGRLSPDILNAWRAGVFSHAAVECVRAFTLAPSVKAQAEVFQRLRKEGRLWPNTIRDAFGAGDRQVAANLALVGRDTYEAAGGRMIVDLFGDAHVISDPPLLQRLAEEAVTAECKRLVDDGWSWVELEGALPTGAMWNWAREDLKPAPARKAEKLRLAELEAIVGSDDATEEERRELHRMRNELKLRAYNADLRAKTGIIVSVSSRGQIDLRPGYSKPSKQKAAKESAGESAERSRPAISNAMMHRLSVELTLAAREAMVADPRTGLVALLAGFLAGEAFEQPVRVRLEGYQSSAARPDERELYSEVFARLSGLSDEELFRVAAGIASDSLNLVRQDAGRPPLAHSGIAAMLDALPADALDAALKAHFDPEDYFTSASKALLIEAIREAGYTDDQARTAQKSKGDLVAFALANVPRTGWLPLEMRTQHYAGPGARHA